MVSIKVRMRTLRSLLNIRVGPGAAILPPKVTKIHMDFATRMNDGHMGPRKFWKECLPRLKYYNPTVSMTINRTDNFEGPALMTVYFADGTASTSPNTNPTTSTETENTTSEPASTRTEIINMKHRATSDILKNLMNVTKATPVEPTQEDIALGQQLEEEIAHAEANSVRSKAVHAENKRKEAMLNEARAGSALL